MPFRYLIKKPKQQQGKIMNNTQELKAHLQDSNKARIYEARMYEEKKKQDKLKKYKVLTYMSYGWDNIWNENSFETPQEAQKEINDHVKTCHENNMECNLNDFKIIKEGK
tara:strand:- start:205 stop:534 length:330 start_codon:yes stop_codon:yes gene_type:complete